MWDSPTGLPGKLELLTVWFNIVAKEAKLCLLKETGADLMIIVDRVLPKSAFGTDLAPT
jgi:hypothetical protein